VVIVPRLSAGLIWNSNDPPIGPGVWRDTRLQLPPGFANRSLTDLFTSRQFIANRQGAETELPIAELLADFPLALLM
jgi:maltooligosyltrehalose synthase